MLIEVLDEHMEEIIYIECSCLMLFVVALVKVHGMGGVKWASVHCPYCTSIDLLLPLLPCSGFLCHGNIFFTMMISLFLHRAVSFAMLSCLIYHTELSTLSGFFCCVVLSLLPRMSVSFAMQICLFLPCRAVSFAT